MFAAYVLAAIVGGGMIVFSAIAGLGAHADLGSTDFSHDVDTGGGTVDHDASFGHDFSHDASHDFSHDTGHDLSHDVSHDAGHHGADTEHAAGILWLPFFSLRFWTYLIGTFGVVGTILTLAKVSVEPVTLVVAAGTGVLTGTFAAWAVRYLSRSEQTSNASNDDFLGALARVTVAIGESPGKVRTSVKGDIIDLVAKSDGGEHFGLGDEVMIVGLDGDQARVARKSDFLGE